MTTLYLDCTHGARKDSFAQGVSALLPREEARRIERAAGISEHADEHTAAHHHHSVAEVHQMIQAKPLPAAAREAALGVYGVLAQAEARAHGVTLEEVHFHEVGSAEAVSWVCYACAAVAALAADEVVASPVRTGFGFVDCAHGRLPIPAPATANVLEDIPTFAGDAEGELTTPTGDALVSWFASRFADEAPAGCELIAQVG